jgi:DNA-binding XRE family transcriptional regulator
MIPCPGVYMIRHKTKQRAYVGSSGNVEQRCLQHVHALNFGNHVNKRLQADWATDGPDNFEMTLLEPMAFEHDRLNAAERAWTERLQSLGLELYCDQFTARAQPVYLPGLRRRRLRAALSQRALAKLAGVAASTVARVELGADVHPSTIGKLAEALKCNPVDIMEKEQ